MPQSVEIKLASGDCRFIAVHCLSNHSSIRCAPLMETCLTSCECMDREKAFHLLHCSIYCTPLLQEHCSLSEKIWPPSPYWQGWCLSVINACLSTITFWLYHISFFLNTSHWIPRHSLNLTSTRMQKVG